MSWYDRDNDKPDFGSTWGYEHSYEFEVPHNKGTLYISVESYFLDMIPEACYSDKENAHAFVDIDVFHNGKKVDTYHRKEEFQPYWFTVTEKNYKEGDQFSINVKYDWNSQRVA
jgi:hypothetical protein